jgi:hypothetical protein
VHRKGLLGVIKIVVVVGCVPFAAKRLAENTRLIGSNFQTKADAEHNWSHPQTFQGFKSNYFGLRFKPKASVSVIQ